MAAARWTSGAPLALLLIACVAVLIGVGMLGGPLGWWAAVAMAVAGALGGIVWFVLLPATPRRVESAPRPEHVPGFLWRTPGLFGAAGRAWRLRPVLATEQRDACRLKPATNTPDLRCSPAESEARLLDTPGLSGRAPGTSWPYCCDALAQLIAVDPDPVALRVLEEQSFSPFDSALLDPADAMPAWKQALHALRNGARPEEQVALFACCTCSRVYGVLGRRG